MGSLNWSHSYGGSNIEEAWSIEREVGSSFVIAGTTNSFGMGGYDGLILRIDSVGSILEEAPIGSTDWDFLYSAVPCSGGYFAVGQTYGFGCPSGAAWVVRLNSECDTIWTRTFDSPYLDELRCVRATIDGGCIVAGTIGDPVSYGDAALIKYDGSGTLEWSRIFRGDSADLGYSVTLTNDGGYVLGGYTTSFSVYREMLLAKTSSTGDSLWLNHIGQIADWEGREVRERPDGGLVMSGYTKGFGGGDADMYLLLTDSNGIYQAGRTYGGIEAEEGWSVDLTTDGGFVTAGLTKGFGPGTTSVFVVKGDSVGMAPDENVTVHFDPLSIPDPSSLNASFIHPNPSQVGEVVHVQSPLGSPATVRFQDLAGREVARFPLNGPDATIHLPDLPGGMYLCEVFNTQGTLRGIRFVVR